MHLFSTDEFLNALADAWFPGKPRDIANYRTAGQTFRLLRPAGEAPITRWPFLDFHQAVDGVADSPVRELKYLPHAVLETRTLATDPPAAVPETEPAPFIAWRQFADWEAFEHHFCARRSSLIRDSRAKRRNLERDVGPIRYVWSDDRPFVFARCLAWKSAQYLRTGLTDLFARPENVCLFRLLHERGSLVISSLSAGDTLLAVHFGALTADARLYSWIAAYDPAHGRYSPGRLLLEEMLKDSFTRGHAEWDFGIGSMDYKWHYATDYRLVGALGTPPLALVLTKAARTMVVRSLGLYPPLLEQARQLRRQLRQLPVRKAPPVPIAEPASVTERVLSAASPTLEVAIEAPIARAQVSGQGGSPPPPRVA